MQQQQQLLATAGAQAKVHMERRAGKDKLSANKGNNSLI